MYKTLTANCVYKCSNYVTIFLPTLYGKRLDILMHNTKYAIIHDLLTSSIFWSNLTLAF